VCDETLSAVISALQPGLCDLSDIHASRATMDGLFAAMPAPEMPADVEVSEVMVPGHLPGDPDVRVKVYRPAGLATGSAAIYWIHGGGMVLMTADMDDFSSAMRAKSHCCLVVSVDYRLAPETPAPGLVRRARWLNRA
jgi:acetyl esterase/lipase